MIVKYKGRSNDYNFRVAEIFFDDENEIEQRRYNRLEQVMQIKGWDLNEIAEGCGQCELEDHDEYNEFVKDYKEVKKSIRLWEKFGI